MYDTIHLEIRECDLDTPISFREKAACNIEIDKAKSTKKKIVGHVDNMSIKIIGSSLHIIGSLTKYAKGNNIKGMNFCEVKKSIESLSKILNIPLEKAIIKRVDIAQTFEMNYEPELYLPKLYYLKEFSKNINWSTSLYFEKESKGRKGKITSLCFYDKNEELRKPDSYHLVQKDCHLLRYELRIMNPTYIFKREIRCFELYSEDFYHELIKLWYDMYNSIEKRLESLEDYCEMDFNGKKELYETCLRLCVMAFDMEKEVDIASKKRKVTPQNKSNVLKKIKEIKEELKKEHPTLSIIDELNEKVKGEYKRQIEDMKTEIKH